jgi:hypothetical protein
MTMRRLVATMLALFCACLMPSIATADPLVKNGDFTGARYGADAGPALKGTLVPAPYNFTSHSYLTDFAWTNTGCYCLDWVAENGSQVIGYAPGNPLGYAGNVYVADAASPYNHATYLMQTITGLTPGKTYTLSFLQASGSNYAGDTDSAQWDVGFGGAIDVLGGDWAFTAPATHKLSALMTNSSSDGTSSWQSQAMTFTASSTDELLSFFATGNGAPPFALLANVSLTPAVPEPSTWAMMLLGIGAIGASMRRRRKARASPSHRGVGGVGEVPRAVASSHIGGRLRRREAHGQVG